MDAGLLFALGLTGFHLAITLLAIARARSAVRAAVAEGRLDRRTLWRLASLRFVAAIVILSGGLLAVGAPSAYVAGQFPGLLPTTPQAVAAILGGAWAVWIPSTIALDNLALRWLGKAGIQRRRTGEPRT